MGCLRYTLKEILNRYIKDEKKTKQCLHEITAYLIKKFKGMREHR